MDVRAHRAVHFETTDALGFSANASELAQLRFGTSAITAGWYTSLLQCAMFFVAPCVGVTYMETDLPCVSMSITYATHVDSRSYSDNLWYKCSCAQLDADTAFSY